MQWYCRKPFVVFTNNVMTRTTFYQSKSRLLYNLINLLCIWWNENYDTTSIFNCTDICLIVALHFKNDLRRTNTTRPNQGLHKLSRQKTQTLRIEIYHHVFNIFNVHGRLHCLHLPFILIFKRDLIYKFFT